MGKKYTVNIKIYENLLSVDNKILDCLNKIIYVKNISDNVYIREINRLKMFLKKENNLINKLPDVAEVNEVMLELFLKNKDIYFSNSENSQIVLNRFYNIISEKIFLLEDAEAYEYMEEDVESLDFENYSYRKKIRNNLYTELLKFINHKIEDFNIEEKTNFEIFSIISSYENKTIFDKLVDCNFDINKLKILSENEMIKDLSVDDKFYNLIYQDELEDFITNNIDELIYSTESIDDVKIKFNLLKFEYLLNLLDTKKLLYIYSSISSNQNKNNVSNKMIEIIGRVLSKRPDKPKESLEPNKKREKISYKTISSLINLIKLEENILHELNEINLDKCDSKIIKKISNYIELEKEIASNVEVNSKTFSIINSVIKDDLEFFLDINDDIDNKNDLITARLYTALPQLYKYYISPSVTFDSHYHIMQNHAINSLKKYEDIFKKCKSSNVRGKYNKTYKDILFTNFGLLEDYVICNGNYKLLNAWNDELSSLIVNTSDIEYCYDKNEELYNYGVLLLKKILVYGQKIEEDKSYLPLYEYFMAELYDIINNINDEHFYDIISMLYEPLDDEFNKSKKKIIKRIIKYDKNNLLNGNY